MGWQSVYISQFVQQHILGIGRKLEKLEGTHADPGRKSTQILTIESTCGPGSCEVAILSVVALIKKK